MLKHLTLECLRMQKDMVQKKSYLRQLIQETAPLYLNNSPPKHKRLILKTQGRTHNLPHLYFVISLSGILSQLQMLIFHHWTLCLGVTQKTSHLGSNVSKKIRLKYFLPFESFWSMNGNFKVLLAPLSTEYQIFSSNFSWIMQVHLCICTNRKSSVYKNVPYVELQRPKPSSTSHWVSNFSLTSITKQEILSTCHGRAWRFDLLLIY